MSGHQTATIDDTVFFWFAANDTSGSGGDGATPLFDVREAGAAASDAPLLSGTPSLLTNAAYPDGCHEISVAATTGNGFAADDTFAVFCTLAIDSQNPTGFVGSCTLTPLAKATVLATVLADTGELQSVLSAGILARTNNPTLEELLGVADVAGEDVPFATWDEVLTGASHNVVDSAGRRLRDLQEFGVYEGGAIWIDTINGVAGTTTFESGTAFNPVDNLADANTLAAAVNLVRFEVAPGSNLTFVASQANQAFMGDGWILALGGQSIAGSTIVGADVSGVSTGEPHEFHDCHLGACTFGGGEFKDCGLEDTITLSAAVVYNFTNCYHNEAGTASTIDFDAGGATEVHIHNWHGNLTILNMGAGDILHFTSADGSLTMDVSCTGGTRNSAGTFGLTDNSSGMTVNDLGQMYQRIGAPVGVDISADIAAIPTTAMRGTDNAATEAKQDIIDTGVDNLLLGIIFGIAQTGTLSTTQATTDLTGFLDNELSGGVIVFTGGTADGQRADITDYASASGLVTFSGGITTAPANNDPFKIV